MAFEEPMQIAKISQITQMFHVVVHQAHRHSQAEIGKPFWLMAARSFELDFDVAKDGSRFLAIELERPASAWR